MASTTGSDVSCSRRIWLVLDDDCRWPSMPTIEPHLLPHALPAPNAVADDDSVDGRHLLNEETSQQF
jgi:hypothetical protein